MSCGIPCIFQEGIMTDFKPVFRMIVTSDIHIQEGGVQIERFREGMKFAYDYAAGQDYNKVDAFFAVGDFANCGSEWEMLAFRDLLDECIASDTEKTLMLASHEFKFDSQQGAYERFQSIYNMERDTHKVLGGFHCISVSTENGCRFGDEKRDWLRTELRKAADADPQKPIFVFQHPHITDTVAGSILWGEDDLTAILMDYPQIIDFSGHSHAPVNDPRSIHQRHFTCHGTGSFSYFELDEFDKIYGTVPPDHKECAQFLIVEADAQGTVRILPVDVLTKNFFPCVREIKTPWEPNSFVYTAKRYQTSVKPYFTDEAKIQVERYENNALTLRFSQAEIAEDMVDDYIVRLRKQKDGTVMKQAAVWSSYYLYNMPETVCVTLADVPAGDYKAEIIAQGFWNNRSETPLTLEFTLD